MTRPADPRPTLGVGGVVFNGTGEVLLVQRSHAPQAGCWHIPGGRLEPGESLTQCCRREVFEETGLTIEPLAIIALADRPVENFHYIIIDFLARLTPASVLDPAPSSDAADARWVHPDEFGELPLVEGLLAVIEAAKKVTSIPTDRGLLENPALPWLFLPAALTDRPPSPPTFQPSM